ncbi:MAG TPA: site-specific DNA-methyltransferase [Prosthecobacter sp.]
MKLNTVIKGDALKELKKLPPASVQTVIADPPYFNVLEDEAWDTQWTSPEDYLAWCEAWVAQCLRVLKDDGLCFIFGQLGKREHAFIHLMSRLCQQHAFHDLIIWDRAVGYNERRDSFTPQYEMILVLRKGDSDKVKFNKDAVRIPYDADKISAYLRDPRYKNLEARKAHLDKGKFATNILRVPSLKGLTKEKCGHPSQKPLALIGKLIACASDEGDLVLDPFLGSGTTAVSAETLGRQWIGIEHHATYARLARKRLKDLRKNAADTGTETGDTAAA